MLGTVQTSVHIGDIIWSQSCCSDVFSSIHQRIMSRAQLSIKTTVIQIKQIRRNKHLEHVSM